MLRYLIVVCLGLCCTFCKNPQKSPSVKIVPTASEAAATASKNGEWLKAAQLYEQLYQKDHSNEEWNYETGTNYLKANYPQKALNILNHFDRKNEDKTSAFNGRIARIAKANYQLEAYEKVEELVKNYNYPKMYRGLAREHLKALIQLNKPTDLQTSFATYQKEKIYDDKGKSTNMGFLYRAICNELLMIDNTTLLDEYANNYYNWAIVRPEKDKRNLAIAAFYQKDFKKATDHLRTAISVEKSPRHRMELEGLLGICYARNKDIEKTLAQIDKIQKMAPIPHRHDAFGAKFYHQARIEVALNQHEKAIKSLKKALAAKAEFWSNRFNEDGLLKDIYEHPIFKEILAITPQK